jgi:hypothetical protein
LSPDDPEHSSLKAREQELSSRCPAYWLAILGPAVWCLVGNIVGERPSGPGGKETRKGTRLFRPNAKIYLAELTGEYWMLPTPEVGRHASVEVIGQHRKSRQWIGCRVRACYTTNWRVRLVHHPGALVRLREADWPGFLLAPGQFAPPEEPQGDSAVRALLEAVTAARREWVRRAERPPG